MATHHSIFSQKHAVIATILDPCFKLVFFPAVMKTIVKVQLLDELYKLIPQVSNSDSESDHEPSAAVHSSVASKSASSTTLAEVDATGDVWSLVFQSQTFSCCAQTAQHENEPKSKAAGSKEDEFVAMTKQLDEYLGLPLQNRLANPLRWWKDHAERFPYLAKLARKYLATPASSVYSERLFSEYGNIFEEKRARLLPKTGEKLLFLHHNIKHLEKL